MSRKTHKTKNRGGAGQNRAESEAFLKKNSSRPGVIVTASGLQYTIKEPKKGSAEEFKNLLFFICP
jgi:FKBP-type peptidyl-prolyl cis-trans isomerase